MPSFVFAWIREFFIHSWWVLAFVLACAILYEQSLQQREEIYQQLNEQQRSLQEEKQLALEEQHRLQRQINSQQDLAWIELTLMKELGVVPEGQKKIYFYPDNSSKLGELVEMTRRLKIKY